MVNMHHSLFLFGFFLYVCVRLLSDGIKLTTAIKELTWFLCFAAAVTICL